MRQGCSNLVGRGSGVAKDRQQGKKIFVGLRCAMSANCRAVGGATNGSAALKPCPRYTDET
jgi:hypothetical protein